MWHYVVIEIFKNNPDDVGRRMPCWNILYKAPIDEVSQFVHLTDAGYELVSFTGCQAWIEQNKALGSKYAIMRMFMV